MSHNKGKYHKKWAITSILFLILIMGLSGCINQFQTNIPENHAIEEYRNTYDVDAGTVLKVINVNGGITVTEWGSEQVELHVFKETNYGESELDKVSVEVIFGDGLTIKTQHPSLVNVKVSTRLNIQVPEDIIVERLESSNGGIVVEDTTGDVTAYTSNGGITFKNVEGSVKAETSNGPIQISEVTNIRGARTSNAKIFVDIPVLNDDLTIETSNAGVSVHINENINANIVMSTVNAKIVIEDVQLTISDLSVNRVEGTMGNGGFELRIITSNGDINLYKLG